MVAALFDDKMRSIVSDKSHYSKFSDMANTGCLVPTLLLQFLSGLIKNKRRQLAIAHSITAAAVSPILLAVYLYVNSKLESRELVDLLSILGFADDYREVLRHYDAMIPSKEPDHDWEGGLVSFVFDNADINIRTHTGHGTWHVMGGISAITPGGNIIEPVFCRSTEVRSILTLGKFAEIPLQRYRKPSVADLKHVLIKSIDQMNPILPSLTTAKALDNIWMASYYVSGPGKCPSWSGFNQTVVNQGLYDISRIEILPFVNHDPNQHDTIFSALMYVQKLADKHKLGICPVTFDQPLYIKAAEIVQSSENINKVVVRLGGFHLVMSYMGAIGHIMSGCGLQDQWETVHAQNSTKHMLTGHAYARALRAHMFSAASRVSHMLDTSDNLSEKD